ncbi:hypothetical protein KsCSTR_07040 [Candidatus Kuenenia stuttgartiensis]|uniref:Uncharacterized protein n=1 Tax=Kuenenia stuttgartiensis TaxID=174633 RepID=Q1PZN4_KUEST|nr:hypothetical protein KsCSTR_07040 [Candidatus Kuenenia stuttgartiensis]CAJ72539.1 unknown protein [Candidatus Kuenenia stuttgartiensis]
MLAFITIKSRGEAFARLGMNLFMAIYSKCFAPTTCGKHRYYWIFSKNNIITH